MNNHACDYDIAIIGGGLAGLTLAIQAADAGHRVVLFEKEVYPYHKVCGEYISNESRNFLLRCGLPLNEWELPLINRLQVSDMAGERYDFTLPLGGFGVSRYQLDNALYTLAKQKGAELITGTKVTDTVFMNGHFIITADGKNYTAYTAAACYGKKSNLDLKWNRSFVQSKPDKISNFIAVKYHIRYPHEPDIIALHNFHNGYCGISRIEDGKSCLCYLTTAANLQRSGNSIARLETEVLSKNRQLKAIFEKAERLYDQPLTISQISFQKKTQVEDHLLMIGDAAGMITPLCGNGMSMAMHGSKIAFEQMNEFIAGEIDRDSMEHRYATKWNQQFGGRTKLGRIVQRFFGERLTTSLFLQVMHRFPALSRSIIKSTHGAPF